ncbi:MAG: hypothetical protein IPP72_13180 [Chitinophagaceae bacterium]|nr:hypothetical protein [Chitinophagaceae bacterium]
MSQVFKYIRSFYKEEFNLFYLLLIIAMLAVIIYLNYWHDLEKKYAASGSSWLAGFAGYYFLYLLPFAAAFLLQKLFYVNCTYFSSTWFWIILLLAPAFFSFRVNFSFHQSWVNNQWPAPENLFYLRSINWVVRVLVVLIPVAIVWWLKDSNNQPFYGTKPLDSLQPYLWMLLIMVPVLFWRRCKKISRQYIQKQKFYRAFRQKGGSMLCMNFAMVLIL